MSKSRDIGDSAATINFIDNLTSDAQTQLNTLTTNVATNATAISNINVTSGSQTKTYSAGETSTITLSGNVLSPIIGVTKEVAQTGVSNNDWDVNSSSENYTRYNSATATTLDFVSDDDVSAATETSITLSGAAQSTSLLGGTIGNAGQNAYMLDQSSGIIYQYLLSTAYVLSSGSYQSKTFDVSSQQSDPRNLFFKSDGTKLYVIGTTGQAIYQYSLSTAWDISTASYDSKTFSASSQSNGTTGLFIKPDGSKLYIVAYSNDAVYQYSLSTAWDISTASYDSVSLSVSSQDNTPRDITFNDDGTVLYMCGTGNNALYQYNLTSAYDLSSASYSSNTLSLSTTVFSITYSSASLQLVIFQSLTDILKTIRLSNTLSLGSGSFASADVGKTIEANSGVFILTSTAGAYSQTTAPTSFAQVASGSWEMYGVVFNTTDGDLELSGHVQLANLSNTALESPHNLATGGANLNTPTGLFMTPDGTKVFVADTGTDDVVQLNLSTAFDITTASYASKYLGVGSQDINPRGLWFSPTGNKMFIVGQSGDKIVGYSVSSGNEFEINQYSYERDFSTSSQAGDPSGVAFNADGTIMLVSDDTDNAIYQYSLSTGFNISTASYANKSLSLSSQISSAQAFGISSDGKKIFGVDYASETVYEYILTTGFDVSTGSYSGRSFAMTSQMSSARFAYILPNDLSFIGIENGSSTCYQYSCSSAFIPSGYNAAHTTTSTDSQYWTDINSMTADEAAGDGAIYYCVSTDDRTTWKIAKGTDGERSIVRNNSGTWQYNSNGTYGSTTWANATTNAELAAIQEAMTAATSVANAYDVSTASFVDKFSTSAQESDETGLAFNADGTKMFIVGTSGDDVNEYTLSTGFDVSTASYSQNFSVASQATSPRGIAFNSTGTRMFIVADTTGARFVYQYNLTTGFDVSTASYSNYSHDVSGQDTTPNDVAFNSDGTKMFVVGRTGDAVYEYTLSTGFDLNSTVTYSQSFGVSSQDNFPTGLTFNPDGTKMFITGDNTNTIYQYTLTTGYDVSTASYASKSFVTSTQSTSPQAIAFNSDGTKMFINGGDQSVMEYDIGTTVYLNQMDKTQLDAIPDANHFTLANDLDLAIIFNMSSGSTAPSSDGVAINYDANVLNQGAILGTDYTYDAPAQNKVRITSTNAANLKIRIV